MEISVDSEIRRLATGATFCSTAWGASQAFWEVAEGAIPKKLKSCTGKVDDNERCVNEGCEKDCGSIPRAMRQRVAQKLVERAQRSGRARWSIYYKES